ncbi:hypothetical protein [Candidatus Uabimicrobium sp. HlEnr_7]|uniref:hypothetical protein n=1 Tax=Candidatus Uabimicrobium helgolandensis TaxID=3095367 RepID=UPI003556BFD9
MGTRKRNYIRKLRHASLSLGYIGKSAFAQNPTRIFACVWPSESSVKERISFFVEYCDNKKCLTFNLKSSREQLFVLKFSKTSTAFDGEGFFWVATKGHHVELKGRVAEDKVIFSDTKQKNNFLHNMLQVIPAKSPVLLSKYLEENFDVIGKNTYGFSAYLQIKFYNGKIQIGKHCEEIYQLENTSFLAQSVVIQSILYEYATTTKNSALKKKDIDILPIASPSQAKAQDANLDIRDVFKNCLDPFISKYTDQQPDDEDYRGLIDDILANLSRIYYE